MTSVFAARAPAVGASAKAAAAAAASVPMLVGADSSPYVHKLRMYFKYRGIEIEEVQNNPDIFASLILPRTNLTMIPVVVDGDAVLSDTGLIMDHYEGKLPIGSPQYPSLVPATPKQRFVSQAFEFMSEDWFFLVGFAQRFGHLEEHERYLLNMVAEGTGRSTGLIPKYAKSRELLDQRFLRARKPWGVTEETMPVFDAYLERFLVQLSAHFDTHRYLLSDEVPCRGDFALAGQLSGFIARDPVPSYVLKTKAPNLMRYLARMQNAPEAAYEYPNRVVHLDGVANAPAVTVTRADTKTSAAPTFLANDVIPPTLYPALSALVDLTTHVEQTHALAVKHATTAAAKSGTSGTEWVELPRAVGYPRFTVGGEEKGTRMAQVFSLFAWARMWRGGVDPHSAAEADVVLGIAAATSSSDTTAAADPDAFLAKVRGLASKLVLDKSVRRNAENQIEIRAVAATAKL
ncbi:hypothetical protein H9P43_001440 [Blastocladiella emersonii ATCC 22665]|nr:hypothetical protein H9P43_001440 [Blastocladiella emersonii ATCC 22665]